MRTKQQFIDDVLGSLDNVPGAEASPFLYEKIAFHLKSKATNSYITRPKVLLQAACVAALLLFNIVACVHFMHTKNSSRQSANSVGQEYFSYLNDYNI